MNLSPNGYKHQIRTDIIRPVITKNGRDSNNWDTNWDKTHPTVAAASSDNILSSDEAETIAEEFISEIFGHVEMAWLTDSSITVSSSTNNKLKSTCAVDVSVYGLSWSDKKWVGANVYIEARTHCCYKSQVEIGDNIETFSKSLNTSNEISDDVFKKMIAEWIDAKIRLDVVSTD